MALQGQADIKSCRANESAVLFESVRLLKLVVVQWPGKDNSEVKIADWNRASIGIAPDHIVGAEIAWKHALIEADNPLEDLIDLGCAG
jgi:hypothetical protein